MLNDPIMYSPEKINLITPEEHQQLIQQTKSRFKQATTGYLKGLMSKSEAIRKQFEPSSYEGLAFGREMPFEEGKNNKGIYGLERIYEDRAVLTPFFGCASYCRYCFKKTRTLGGGGEMMSQENIDDAIEYIQGDSRITTALITGGDPLTKPKITLDLVRRLIDIPHIRQIRIGTRHILFNPRKITEDIAEQLAELKSIDVENPLNSTNISIGVSINHPDEFQPEVIQALQHFIKRGISVRGQMVLMKGINDDVNTIRTLLDSMLAIGVTPYYLFHCMDVVGTYHMRTSVQKGLDILSELAEFSGVYAIPYVYVTPVGKHRISPGHKLDYVTIDGNTYIRKTSPYKADRFLQFSDNQTLPPNHSIDENGYIVSHYLDGDDVSVNY